MVFGLEHMLYGATLGIGLSCFGLGYAHRGAYDFDSERGVHVSNGTGISSKIIDSFPDYRHISPLVDHFLAGVGFTTSIAGAMGLIIQSEPTLASHPDAGQLILPYTIGTLGAWGIEATWEGYTFLKRKMQVGLNDLAQYAVDVSAPLGLLYTADAVIGMM